MYIKVSYDEIRLAIDNFNNEYEIALSDWFKYKTLMKSIKVKTIFKSKTLFDISLTQYEKTKKARWVDDSYEQFCASCWFWKTCDKYGIKSFCKNKANIITDYFILKISDFDDINPNLKYYYFDSDSFEYKFIKRYLINGDK